MTEEYRFFNSAGGDTRLYQAAEYAEYFATLIANGVWAEELNALLVTGHGGEMKTLVDTGKAFVDGYYYENDASKELTHSTAHATLNRIDRVILRLDTDIANRYLKLFVLEGTPAETPAPPTLTQAGSIWEISLAQVLVIAGQSYIETATVTDERADETVCGYARYKTKPAWYPAGVVPLDAWNYLAFPDELTGQEISDIQGNPTLMAKIEASRIGQLPVNSVTANHTLTLFERVLLVATSTVNITVTLPPVADAINRAYDIKKTDGNAYTVTVTPDGAETIDGASSLVIGNQYESYTLVSDGTNWYNI